jgi:acetyl-CoA carboxylase biotin carboxyl carrier protein
LPSQKCYDTIPLPEVEYFAASRSEFVSAAIPSSDELQPDDDRPQVHNDDAALLEYWRGLAQIAREEELAELEVESAGVRVTLRATSVIQIASTHLSAPQSASPFGPVAFAPGAAPQGSAPPASAAPAARDENLVEIVSPMVGVFYRAPSPSDPNFVEAGDKVEIGQTVALVEAMKVFNEITSEVAGVVAEIKANSSDLVETGQAIIIIRRS